MIDIIATGSKGNCYIYNTDLMIDVGLPFNKIKGSLKNIRAIFLTHKHKDHINVSTLKKIMYEKPTIKVICCDYLKEFLIDSEIDIDKILFIKLNKKYDFGKYNVTPVLAPHDCSNCGYKIIVKSSNYKIFHITDVATIKHINAKNYDLYAIEGNYDEEEIKNRVEEKEKNGGFIYEDRVVNTHLSIQQANDWLLNNMGNNSKYVFIHQHTGGTNE